MQLRVSTFLVAFKEIVLIGMYSHKQSSANSVTPKSNESRIILVVQCLHYTQMNLSILDYSSLLSQ